MMASEKEKTILFFAANLGDTTRLRLASEVMKIQDGLEGATFRDSFLPISKLRRQHPTLCRVRS